MSHSAVTNRPAATGWGTIAVRTFLVVLPAVLFGFLLATALLPGSLLVAHPHLGWLLDVPAGALAGLGLGLLLHPSRERVAAQLVLSAGTTAVVVLALLALAQLRVPASASGPELSAVALAVVVPVVVQVAVTAGLWRARAVR